PASSPSPAALVPTTNCRRLRRLWRSIGGPSLGGIIPSGRGGVKPGVAPVDPGSHQDARSAVSPTPSALVRAPPTRPARGRAPAAARGSDSRAGPDGGASPRACDAVHRRAVTNDIADERTAEYPEAVT